MIRSNNEMLKIAGLHIIALECEEKEHIDEV